MTTLQAALLRAKIEKWKITAPSYVNDPCNPVWYAIVVADALLAGQHASLEDVILPYLMALEP